MLGQLEYAILYARKASKLMDELFELRKEQYPEYQVLLAGFYYKVGDSLCNYVECNTDEMNQLKPLEMPEVDNENDEESNQEEDGEEEAGAEDKEAAAEEPAAEADAEDDDQIDSGTKPKEEEKEDITQP